MNSRITYLPINTATFIDARDILSDKDRLKAIDALVDVFVLEKDENKLLEDLSKEAKWLYNRYKPFFKDKLKNHLNQTKNLKQYKKDSEEQ